MAPYSDQNQLSSSQNGSTTTNAGTGRSGISPARTRGPLGVTEASILDHAYGVPLLHAPAVRPGLLINPQRQGRPASKHGRSMSQPFPSLFQSKEKRQGGNAMNARDSKDEDTLPSHFQSPTKNPASKLTRVPDKDLVTGKCMTCDSTVRWPKELHVFRCTVCLTINDLKPKDGNPPRAGLLSPTGSRWREVLPLSNVKTRALIEECITSYLLSRLEHHEENVVTGTDPGPQPSLLSPKNREILAPPRDQGVLNGTGTNELQNAMAKTIDRRDGQPVLGPKNRSVRFSGDNQNGNILRLHSSSTPRNYDPHMAGGFNPPERPSISAMKALGGLADLGSSENLHSAIFKALEDYIVTAFTSRDCVNTSFTISRPRMPPRAASEGSRRIVVPTAAERHDLTTGILSEMDAKTLLIGDFAENGSWWTGGREPERFPDASRSYHRKEASDLGASIVSIKTPRIDWAELRDWYRMVLHAGYGWNRYLNGLLEVDPVSSTRKRPSTKVLDEIEEEILEAQAHTQRVLMKATESLLKRPGAPLKEPDDIRFLLIILENPLLYPSTYPSGIEQDTRHRSRSSERRPSDTKSSLELPRRPIAALSSKSTQDQSPGQHSGIIKRIFGLVSNLPNECHHYLAAWFTRFSETHFERITDLVGSFVTYRLMRQNGKRQIINQDHVEWLIPSLAASGARTPAAASLHAALRSGTHSKESDKRPSLVLYNDDWQIKAAARVMAILFSANSSVASLRNDVKASDFNKGHVTDRERARRNGQILPTSSFYNTLLDYSDLIADFEAWENKRGKFSFCQYPFFLSIWAKIQIMEHDARRQMEIKAREAFFDSIMTHKSYNQYLVLKIRRECLVEDSLKGVSEVVGSGGEEIKKGLRIEFKGEEGIDAGGLRKEWFLLLVRDVFNPDHGMFTYDDDSHFCYFNPNSFETSDQFFLVGVVLGLAIYNSTILDVALPPFAFRKLLAAGPSPAPGAPSYAKLTVTYSLEDLAELRPALANGLRQLLDYDGDVESTFCRDFVADVERYGQIVQVPLCPNGELTPVTNANRGEFVDLYVRYMLDTAVTRQFEPFKRGFFTVCGGNPLSLFRPDEIELLICGSDEPLDIASLRAVAIYENWHSQNAAEDEPVIGWFWNTFEKADSKDQRNLLSFITGSDRIPAMGAANLVIKLSCLGGDSPRYPVARTCFNSLSLWRYSSRQKLENMLWRAVNESEGFGLK